MSVFVPRNGEEMTRCRSRVGSVTVRSRSFSSCGAGTGCRMRARAPMVFIQRPIFRNSHITVVGQSSGHAIRSQSSTGDAFIVYALAGGSGPLLPYPALHKP